MLSSNILIFTGLLFIMISLHYAQDIPIPGCQCYNPNITLANGTLPCQTPGCSRGNDTNCYIDDDGHGTILNLRAFEYIIYDAVHEPYAGFFGCNCPGFTFDDMEGANAYLAISNGNGDKNDYIYEYKTCKEFGEPMISAAATCCHYCCGTPDVPVSARDDNSNN